MRKCIGLDVGGTFTDIVLLQGETIESVGKVRTEEQDILGTVLRALDSLDAKDARHVDRITVSTTLATNAIVQEKLSRVELVLFPGSGIVPGSFKWPFAFHTLSGEMDFRGRVVREPDLKEWRELAEKLKCADLPESPLVCIVSKFSHRNKIFEEQLAAFLRKEVPQARFALGHEWGQINFYRRVQTSYLDLATRRIYEEFSQGLQEAVRVRGYAAPVSVLKADGGMLPIEKASAVQTIYSGPAASVLGALAQTEGQESFFVVNIGGTTTDIGAVLSGVPLLGARGACIGAYTTNVRSLAVRSAPVGGDSTVCFAEGKISLAESREGPASCLGGPALTPTDAMRYLNLTDHGDRQRAEEALLRVLPEGRGSVQEVTALAEGIITEMTLKIHEAMKALHCEWEDEPAYRVWEVLCHESKRDLYVQLSGGSALALAEAFARRMSLRVELAEHAQSTNALGSALARPSFSSTLHLDTLLGQYRIEETGEQGKWTGCKRPHEDAVEFLRGVMERRARDMGLELGAGVEVDDFSYFPQVEDSWTVGQIVQGAMHMPVGVLGRVRTYE
ncbi:MAG: hydantoinase/oxoprolinase family protein [Peptococcaceae bacterium]|nr:hydantoinase/oxoprolinase family protein [Peptococcaceae bacterium]